jgi:lipoprotein-anchoring transpeptidase ErfK/SrfK
VTALVAAVSVYLVLPVSDSDATGQQGETSGNTSGNASVVATARTNELPVFAAKGDTSPSSVLTPPRAGVPVVTLVVDREDQWLQVLLPVRPNGATGWVKTGDVKQSLVTYRVTVTLHDHRMVVRDGSSLVLESTVAVGTEATPTPVGRFFITELLSVPDPTGPYGPYAYGLSGHSPVLDNFAEGDGQLGLHGTNQPGLLGTDASHGCIRLSNEDIDTLADRLPLGTPVDVLA